MDMIRVKHAIDLSFERVVIILDTFPSITRIIYSCDDDDPKLIGTGIFKGTIGDDVVRYISDQIQRLPLRAKSKYTIPYIRMRELQLLPFALSVHENARKDRLLARLQKPYSRGPAGGDVECRQSTLLSFRSEAKKPGDPDVNRTGSSKRTDERNVHKPPAQRARMENSKPPLPWF